MTTSLPALLLAFLLPAIASGTPPAAILSCANDNPDEKASLYSDSGRVTYCPDPSDCAISVVSSDNLTEAYPTKNGCHAKGPGFSFEPLGSGNYLVRVIVSDAKKVHELRMNCRQQGACPTTGQIPEGHAAPDFAKIRAKCEANDAVSCGDLGAMYALGKGIPRDDSLAFSFYKKACQMGDAERCSRMGDFYMAGRGVQKDQKSAFLQYKIACEKAYAMGCINATMFADGGQIDQDPVAAMPEVLDDKAFWMKTAIPTLEKACEQGLGLACGTLGGLHARGVLFKQDFGPARELYAKACERGEARRCLRAGELFLKGQGGSKQEERAKQLFRKGCQLKIQEACKASSSLPK